jgi:hypothetical protein
VPDKPMRPSRPSPWEFAEFRPDDMEAQWLAGWEIIGTRQRRGRKMVLMRRLRPAGPARSALSQLRRSSLNRLPS